MPPPSKTPTADAFVHESRRALTDAQANLAAVKKVQQAYADHSRLDHEFQVRDKVMLETKYLRASPDWAWPQV